MVVLRSIDATHDPKLRSWVESANQPDVDFPIQNLPFGVFAAHGGRPRLGVAIGDEILDLRACAERGLLPEELRELCLASQLNALMAAGSVRAQALRQCLSELLRAGAEVPAPREALLHRQAEVRLLLPAAIGDYSDFYASIHHATNVGTMLRPENPLLPNYKWLPVGYHGRASTVVVSGHEIRRPRGQSFDEGAGRPKFGPSVALDYELELGCFVGRGNRRGEPIPIGQAEEHLFVVCLLNDWSARDLQKWEYQPLGPFLSKSFATSISPWVVTMEALAPFRVPAFARAAGDPAPLPHLFDATDASQGGLDLWLEVELASASMRERGLAPLSLSRGNFAGMYWTFAQMLAHHASNGCELRAGDLLGSGTVSGPDKSNRGCLLELTWRGSEPIVLPSGEERRYLADGDELVLRGFCERPGAVRIGLGECRGIVTAALER
jgi:fumarylacetoacetase